MKQVTIKNDHLILMVLDYGAVIQKLMLKNSDETYSNVVVGHEFPSDYLDDELYLGACVGRYAGRIGKEFTLDRETYQLPNDHGVHLHGGREGFSKKYWKFEEVHYGENPYVKLSYESAHLEEGYPGNLKTTVTYALKGKNLRIIFDAVTDRATVVNLTNHSYFKLDDEASINEYRLQLNCSHFLETKPNLLPTGKAYLTEGSSKDFTKEKSIGDERLDTPFVVDMNSPVVAKCSSPKSGISMEVATNQVGMVVYTPSNFGAICFETQNLPDAPNHKNFPNCVLRPKEKYRNISEFRFSTN